MSAFNRIAWRKVAVGGTRETTELPAGLVTILISRWFALPGLTTQNASRAISHQEKRNRNPKWRRRAR
jgi:hypothetical protein